MALLYSGHPFVQSEACPALAMQQIAHQRTKAPVDIQTAQRPDYLIWMTMTCRDLVPYVQLKRERDHRAALQQELEALKRGLGRGRATAAHSQPHQPAEAGRWSPSRSALFPGTCRPLRL